MVKKLLVVLVLVCTGVAASGVASAGGDLCPRNRVCIFDHNDYYGLLGTKGPGRGLTTVSSRANDMTDSWKNRTRRNAAWYDHSRGRGPCHTMLSGHKNRNLSFGPSDELSSWRANRKCRSR